MRFVVVMNGTVPVLFSRVLHEDGWNDETAPIEDGLAGYAYVVSCPDTVADPNGAEVPTTWVVLDVNENGGVDTATPARHTIDAAFIAAEMCDQDPTDKSVYHDVAAGHFVVTYDEGGERESYAHAFRVGEGGL